MVDFVIKYWVQIAFGLIITSVTQIYRSNCNKIALIKNKHHATELGVRALLRNTIITMYNKYEDKGEIPIYELENLDDLYEQYKNLGGNGVIAEIVCRIKVLKITK